MSVIVIGDVHGSIHWKTFVAKRKAGDIIVFLGDYFDIRNPGRALLAKSELNNFLEIASFARSTPNVHLLVGNHDFQYTPWDPAGCSGRNLSMAGKFGEAIMDNLALLEMVFVLDRPEKPVIMSHAGVTSTFMRLNNLDKPEEINALWRQRPENFAFKLEMNGRLADMRGDNEWQSPIWVRDNALARDALPGYNQIVGHTPRQEISGFGTDAGDSVLVVCSLDEHNFIEFIS